MLLSASYSSVLYVWISPLSPMMTLTPSHTHPTLPPLPQHTVVEVEMCLIYIPVYICLVVVIVAL